VCIRTQAQVVTVWAATQPLARTAQLEQIDRDWRSSDHAPLTIGYEFAL
jgi:exonuclease III